LASKYWWKSSYLNLLCSKEGQKPIMCAYKLVTVNFSYWGLRTKVEKMIQDVR
jgi:hypothetical protein